MQGSWLEVETNNFSVAYVAEIMLGVGPISISSNRFIYLVFNYLLYVAVRFFNNFVSIIVF